MSSDTRVRDPLDQHTVEAWQMVRAGDHPLAAGASNEDASGVETWTYGGGENHRVCRLALGHATGLEPVWELPTTALLAEMFVHGGRSEPRRAYTRTACHHAPPPRGVVVGTIRLGRGLVVIDQFVPPRGADGAALRPRHLRPANRLRANLGLPPPRDLLAGEATAGNPAASAGFPVRLHLRAGAVAGDERAALLADCAYSPERMLATPILQRGTWQRLEAGDGAFALPDGESWLYLVVHSPVARQNLATNLGIPNPEALTFCDLEGGGRVELWINGAPAGQSAVPGALTDLALAQGFNHLLLRRRGPAGRLALRFRNIMRRAETEFGFP